MDTAAACQSGSPAINNLNNATNVVDPEIRYANVGTHNGQSIDLVVTQTSPNYFLVSTDTPFFGCQSNKFGMIGVQAGTTVDLNFAFQYSSTKQEVTLKNIAMTFFDLDRDNGGDEQLIVSGRPSTTYETPVTNVYTVSPGVFQSCRITSGARLPWSCLHLPLPLALTDPRPLPLFPLTLAF